MVIRPVLFEGGRPISAPHGPLVHADGSVTFRVWAPHAERVTIVVGDRAHDLAGARGWHAARVPAADGDRYAFRLDGGPERPDPASRWQPDGVHGRSAVFDAAGIAWSEQEGDWRPPSLDGACIYELHVGTFTPQRTLDAAALRLTALAQLGVTHVELMPVNAFDGVYGWGYDGVCWYAVHEPYGGPAALARFVEAAHRAGLAVVLDVVYNHLGPSGNYLPDFGPYLTDAHRTPWGQALNVDGPGSDEVRAFILGNALSWFTDFHVDALRLDAVHAIVDNSAVHLLTELADTVEARAQALRRPLTLIAETDRNDPRALAPRGAGGQGLDAQWVDDLHHAVHVAVTGERDGYYVDYSGLPDVAAAYRHGYVYGGRYSPLRERRIGAPLGDDVPGRRLVTCLQNHDQIGNRAFGERLETLVAPALARVAVVLLCASPTTPMLFMGEEYGEVTPFQFFASYTEPALAEALRVGRQAEFAIFASFAGRALPDPLDPDTLARSTLDPARADTERGRQRLALWRDLLALRRAHPALGVGRRDLVTVLHADAERLVVVRRDVDGETVLLAVNLADTPAQVPLPGTSPTSWRTLLSSEDPRYGGSGAEPLAPQSAVLLLAQAL